MMIINRLTKISSVIRRCVYANILLMNINIFVITRVWKSCSSLRGESKGGNWFIQTFCVCGWVSEFSWNSREISNASRVSIQWSTESSTIRRGENILLARWRKAFSNVESKFFSHKGFESLLSNSLFAFNWVFLIIYLLMKSFFLCLMMNFEVDAKSSSKVFRFCSREKNHMKSSWDRLTHRATFFLKSTKFSLHSFAASTLAWKKNTLNWRSKKWPQFLHKFH